MVYATNTAGETTADAYFSTKGWNTGNSDASNYNVGHIYQEDVYQNSNLQGQTPLRTTIYQYTGNCNTAWTPGCPSPTYPNSCNGNYSVVYSPCEVMVLGSITTEKEKGNGSGNPPSTQVNYTYDDYTPNAAFPQSGLIPGYHNLLTEQVSPSNAATTIKKWTYQVADNMVGNWLYYDVHKVAHSEIDDSSGSPHQWECQYTTYDEGAPNGMSAGWPTTVKTYQSSGCNSPGSATPLTISYSGYDAFGNQVATVDGIGAANSSLYSSAGCSASPTIKSSSWTNSHYTTCTAYDSNQAQIVSETGTASGTVNLTTQIGYDSTQGQAPVTRTDANNVQTQTIYGYDSSGNSTIDIKQHDETGSYTTRSGTYAACGTTSLTSLTPCYQTYSLSSLYPGVLSQTYYDGMGRVIQSSTPIAPPTGADTSKKYFSVTMGYYDDLNHSTFKYLPFVVVGNMTIGSSTGVAWIDSSLVRDYTGANVHGTATYYDVLGRPVAFFDSSGLPGISCPSLGYNTTDCIVYGYQSAHGDSNLYETVTSIDANNHVTKAYTDELGNTRYIEYYSGVNSGTLTINEQIAIQYNLIGEPTSTTTTDLASPTGSNQSVMVTATYDDLGRVLTQNDPDKGNHTYTYDANGNVLTDVSGTRTIGYNYDLSGRLGCVQSGAPSINASGACTAGTQPLVQNFYDSSNLTLSGTTDYPIGRLTRSIATTVYNDQSTATATTSYEYDLRGRTIGEQLQIGVPSGWGMTTALPTYQEKLNYNDVNQLVTSLPLIAGQAGPSTTSVYDSTTGAQTGVSNNGSTTTANLATVSYNNSTLLDTLNFFSTTGSVIASEQFGYDNDLRLNSASACWHSLGCGGTNGTIFSQTIGYDPASNVTSSSMTYSPVTGVSGSGGNDTQNFCYDEQNRLIWSGNTSAPPSAGNGTCGSVTAQSGLSGASYTNSFVYTHLGQLYQAPVSGGTTQNQYLYCNAGNPHQLTGLYALGSTCSNKGSMSYSVTYDNWGNVNSRHYGTTNEQLYYDALDHFTEWVGGANRHEWYVYDASGTRVLRHSVGGANAYIAYTFGAEHTYDSTGATNTGNTYYYGLAGSLIASQSGTSTLTTQYLLEDGLGSVVTAFGNAAGTTKVTGNQAYGPYGSSRYKSGTISTTTSKGFTGQYNDGLTGLDYYGSRYYDPKAGVFLSADTVQGNWLGMNPYGYVGGNPETYSDPTGESYVNPLEGGGGGFGIWSIGIGGQIWGGWGGNLGDFGKTLCSSGTTCDIGSKIADGFWNDTPPDYLPCMWDCAYESELRGPTPTDDLHDLPQMDALLAQEMAQIMQQIWQQVQELEQLAAQVQRGIEIAAASQEPTGGGPQQGAPQQGDPTGQDQAPPAQVPPTPAPEHQIQEKNSQPPDQNPTDRAREIGRGYHNETIARTPVKASEATNIWEQFLGKGPYTDIHPRTGQPDPDRIVSADGTRSVRFGSHEMESRPTKFHFHLETWTYDPLANVMNVDNLLVRVIGG